MGWKHLLSIPVVFLTLHFSYGIGFLIGLIRFCRKWFQRENEAPQSYHVELTLKRPDISGVDRPDLFPNTSSDIDAENFLYFCLLLLARKKSAKSWTASGPDGSQPDPR